MRFSSSLARRARASLKFATIFGAGRLPFGPGGRGVKAQSDAVVFEFDPTHARKLKIRDDIRRWQPTLGTLLQVQITYAQYLLDTRLVTLPQPIAEAQLAFQRNMALVMRALADEIDRKPSDRKSVV